MSRVSGKTRIRDLDAPNVSNNNLNSSNSFNNIYHRSVTYLLGAWATFFDLAPPLTEIARFKISASLEENMKYPNQLKAGFSTLLVAGTAIVG